MATPLSPGAGHLGSFAFIEQLLDGRDIRPRLQGHERREGMAVEGNPVVVRVIAASGTIEDFLDRVELVNPHDDVRLITLVIDDPDPFLRE
jgi:hypothetical protein